MSYEGYEQVLCQNGHLDEIDAFYFTENDYWKCDVCGASMAWRNSVDQTNCLPYPENEEIKLEVKTPAVICKCSSCGNLHRTQPETYHIPAEGGIRE